MAAAVELAPRCRDAIAGGGVIDNPVQVQRLLAQLQAALPVTGLRRGNFNNNGEVPPASVGDQVDATWTIKLRCQFPRSAA